jgi:hypothetical protein
MNGLIYACAPAVCLRGVDRDSFPWLQAAAAMLTRSAVFWDIAQRWVVVLYRHFGTTYRSLSKGQEVRRFGETCRPIFRRKAVGRFRTTYGSHLQGSGSPWTSWPLKMGLIGCPETLVKNYRSTSIADLRSQGQLCLFLPVPLLSKVSSYDMNERGNGIRIPAATTDFYFLCVVETGCGASDGVLSRIRRRLRSGGVPMVFTAWRSWRTNFYPINWTDFWFLSSSPYFEPSAALFVCACARYFRVWIGWPNLTELGMNVKQWETPSAIFHE